MRVVLLSAVFLIFCCGENEPVPPPTGAIGALSLNANLSSSEPFDAYIGEYQSIKTLGATAAQTAAPWSSLHPGGGQFDFSAINNPFFGLAQLQSQGYEQILLNIPIVAITERKMPSDIASLPFNHPEVKERFRQLIDHLGSQLAGVTYLGLGNEVDSYFDSHPAEWPAFIELVGSAKTHLQSSLPAIKVGVTTTFDGFSGSQRASVEALNELLDVVMLTYYPISSGFQVRAPNSVESDFNRMLQLSKNKPIILQEVGYPSSSILGGSELLQAEFVQGVFNAWRQAGKEKIPMVSFFKYRDWNTAHVQQITGQSPGHPFYEFMSTLGLLKNDRTAKASFTTLQDEMKK